MPLSRDYKRIPVEAVCQDFADLLFAHPVLFNIVTRYKSITMRSAALLRVALSLLAADSVIAGPCRPSEYSVPLIGIAYLPADQPH